MRRWSMLAAAVVFSFQGCAAAPGAVRVRKLAEATATASQQPIRRPAGDLRIILSDYVIAAGARLPVHKHPHPRLALVLEGSIAVTNVETGETLTYGAGEMVVESVDQWHFGVNTGGSPARLLVLDEVPKDVTSNTVIQR
jgi:quercetin dioxygenase-like cupin family protein